MFGSMAMLCMRAFPQLDTCMHQNGPGLPPPMFLPGEVDDGEDEDDDDEDSDDDLESADDFHADMDDDDPWVRLSFINETMQGISS